MAKEFDNSVSVFARPSPAWILTALGAAIFLSLTIGLITAVALGNWLYASIFLISVASAAVLFYIAQSQSRRLTAVRDGKAVNWNTALPELQRQTLHVEVNELSNLLEIGTEQIGDLQSAYIVAEDLALRQIQQEENAPLIRHVNVGGVPFDAVLAKDGLLICMEVAFLVAPDLRQDKIEAVMRKMASAKKAVDNAGDAANLRLMLVLVTQLIARDEETLRARLKSSRFSGTPVDIDIRFLDFEALQKIYITE
ncbi:MAG: hypothetical protein LC730_03815 [Acidobacteria bacterium]|nr:hypothetical protein [Acidobacteriota bacterium]MCA1608573.1 hypothetical protein [Acidobacteriota bacterium]